MIWCIITCNTMQFFLLITILYHSMVNLCPGCSESWDHQDISQDADTSTALCTKLVWNLEWRRNQKEGAATPLHPLWIHPLASELPQVLRRQKKMFLYAWKESDCTVFEPSALASHLSIFLTCHWLPKCKIMCWNLSLQGRFVIPNTNALRYIS